MGWVRKIDSQVFEIIEMILGGIIPIILIVIGTIGNILCINYFLQRRYRQQQSAYIYLIFLCLADTLSLYQWNLNYIVMEFTNGEQLSDRSLFLCRSIAFLSFYTLHLSAVFLTLVVIDRTLVCWLSFYRKHMTKRMQALMISLIVFLLLFILDGFLLSLGILDENTKQVICYYSENLNLMHFYQKIYPWIHLITMYIIPFLLMIIGITLIIIKLCIHRTHTAHFNSKQRLSVMLIAMCILYMILTLPNRLCFSVFFSSIINHVYTDTIFLASNTLLYTRNATNIFFLCVSSVKFRRQLTKISCYYCRRHDQSRIRPVEQAALVMRIEQIQSGN